MRHLPVMLEEVMTHLDVQPDGTYWDGTFGRGGHARRILEGLGEDGRLIVSDRDGDAMASARQIDDDPRVQVWRGSLSTVLPRVPQGLSGFLWDLGVSTPQLRDAERGFSFNEEGPLDMRMDRESELRASDLVNRLDERELADTIYKYGEERLSRRIARFIIEARAQAPIEDTKRLADICVRAYPGRRYHRIHPATRTFQALRIAVNDELGEVERGLPIALSKLEPGGRAVVISFHSGEDRIVKHSFRAFVARGYRILTKRPLVPGDQERAENPASRSAKMRAILREE